MPPNIVDVPVQSQENEDIATKASTSDEAQQQNASNLEEHTLPTNRAQANTSANSSLYTTRTVLSTINLLAHILIGAVVGIAMIFAFRNGLPLGATPLHIALCVMGYQLLMAEAILSLSSNNGWSSHLRLVDKRRAHWILQILGSGLAITGSFIKILDKTEHWTTLHGRFALVALVFTSVSLVNGLASLWSYELRRFLPSNISKLTHICFGTVGFSAACICLCFGFDKGQFRNGISDSIAATAISFTSALAFFVILAPLASFYAKSRSLISR